MRRMGLCFEVVAAEVEEDASGMGGAARMVADNAALKADAVASGHPGRLVLGADTTVEIDGALLGKPADYAAARATLARLSGVWHSVHTGVALRWKARDFRADFVETSRVRFHDLTPDLIEGYIARVDPLDKAGAYSIGEARELLVAAVEGEVENVMGLPIRRVQEMFSEHGFDFRNPN